MAAIARDLAQATVIAAGGPNPRSSRLIASADHVLLTGRLANAVSKLAQVA